jgi:hypothetical protein
MAAIGAIAAMAACAASAQAGAYHSQFAGMHDRIWVGPDLWANPMEDWRVQGGRLECTTAAPDRNVQVLTHQLGKQAGLVTMSVRLGRIEGGSGAAGFAVGVHDVLNDYRGNLFFGKGICAVITTDGELVLDGKTVKLAEKSDLADVTLRLEAKCDSENAALTLTAVDTASGKRLGEAAGTVRADTLIGNLALSHNPPGAASNAGPGKAAGAKGGKAKAGGAKADGAKGGARFWFNDWSIDGGKVEEHADRRFGPILFAMHTLTNSRGPDGYVIKMTAQMPPIGEADSQAVRLEVRQAEAWKPLGEQRIDADARTATFRVPNWPGSRDVPYRLVYTEKFSGAADRAAEWAGTVRKDPVDRPLVVAGFTGHFHTGYPFAPVVRNVAKTNPDVMFFSGDQIYEANGGYGIIRQPAERAILNYLRKWYMFGWVWADMLRDRPAICLPDDHDVFHGNLWGESGKPMAAGGNTSSEGGYIEPARMVNVVHRTNTAHLPDAYDPTPGLQGITVYYCDWVYGRTSFAILADRQFKSGPELVKTDGPRADWVKGPNFDTKSLDKPGLMLLGERQLKFLDHWAGDWRGADMKMALSQTVFAGAATHHGSYGYSLQADLDCGGWPQSARNKAIRVMRKGYPLHYDGDQHLPTLIHYGVDEPRDACWSFCTPAVCACYQRWWNPDRLNMPHTDRPAHGLPDTGQYLDGFGNLIYVYAVGNPEGTGAGAANRYDWAQDRAGGFGVVTVDRDRRTYTIDCYKFLADLDHPKPGDQFPGWPLTINQRDNYGRKIVGYLPEVSIAGVKDAVLQVLDQKTGELVYAIRLTGNTARPWVFAEGTYTVKIGDPDADKWETFKDQTVAKAP